ncbi:MAG: hypothetical protein ACRD0H_17255 [Actinomycetes bacterium]
MNNNGAGALGAWLEADVEPHLVNGFGRTVGASPLVAVGDVAVEHVAELEQMRAELAVTRARAQLQSDPAWLAELSPEELAAERAAAEKIRGMRRDRQVAVALAMGKLGGREQRVEGRLARMELSDRLWSRRATARRLRLLDPTSRLASLHRTHVATSAALVGVAVAGVAWTSMGVHDALVGEGGNPAAYVVEPLFSIPLLVIMALSARAAQFGRTFPPPNKRVQVYLMEAFLLVATIAMNSVAVLPGFGRWQGTAMLLAHVFPPVLIAASVVLQPLVAGFLGEILTDAHVGAAGNGPVRLDQDTVDTLTLVARVRQAMSRGQLSEWDDTGLPSISSIRRHFHCEKLRAQAVHDAMQALGYGRAGVRR